MKLLSDNVVQSISGGRAIEVYPPYEPGFELIGWVEEVVGWDVSERKEHGFFETRTYIDYTPIYSITPIYEPRTMVIY